MTFAAIKRLKSQGNGSPNMADNEWFRESFTWEKARRASGAPAKHTEFRFPGKNRALRDFDYAALKSLTDKFANVLKNRGVEKGGRAFALAGRIPELYITALGVLKNRSVFCPLFSAFGSEPIRTRAEIGAAKVFVTSQPLLERKRSQIHASLPALKHIIMVGENGEKTESAGTLDFYDLIDEASDEFTIGETNAADAALLHFTSGTTGKPKGAVHVHEAVVVHRITGKLALDFHAPDMPGLAAHAKRKDHAAALKGARGQELPEGDISTSEAN